MATPMNVMEIQIRKIYRLGWLAYCCISVCRYVENKVCEKRRVTTLALFASHYKPKCWPYFKPRASSIP